jgi:hypothetical protein
VKDHDTDVPEVRLMSSRTRTAIVAGALGLAVLAPTSGAFAQTGPPRDPNPPARSGEPGPCPQGYDDRGGMHGGYYDDQGQWHRGDNGMHGGYYDSQGRWHQGNSPDRDGWHHGMR